MEVARALGFVEVKPRTGIRRLPFDFSPAVRLSLNYAIERDRKFFDDFSDLRIHIEASYWQQAVQLLIAEDNEFLKELIQDAWKKLAGNPVRIPHREHRAFHLTIYRRLENPFVLGILESFWDAYESVGLNLYTDFEYLEKVWKYHQKMAESICSGDYEAGYQALIEHNELLYHRPGQVLTWEVSEIVSDEPLD